MDTKDMKNADDSSASDLFNSLDDLISTDDIEFRTIKAWGGRMARLGSLTSGQMIDFLENNDNPANRRRNGLLLIAQSLVDKDGKRLVNTEDAEEVKKAIDRLKIKDAKINGTVVDKILDLNGLNKKDAKEIAKNASGEAGTGASPTD